MFKKTPETPETNTSNPEGLPMSNITVYCCINRIKKMKKQNKLKLNNNILNINSLIKKLNVYFEFTR